MGGAGDLRRVDARHPGRAAHGGPNQERESKEQSKEQAQTGEWKKQYWATSLARTVDDEVLAGLYEAVARGEVGWLDVDPKFPIPRLTRGINLILYHVGGNCYIGDDCARFPASRPTGDRWGGSERSLDLTDPAVRKVLIEDLVAIVRRGDDIAPEGSIVGIHLDNVHKLDAQGLADMFNEFLAAVEVAREQGRISEDPQGRLHREEYSQPLQPGDRRRPAQRAAALSDQRECPPEREGGPRPALADRRRARAALQHPGVPQDVRIGCRVRAGWRRSAVSRKRWRGRWRSFRTSRASPGRPMKSSYRPTLFAQGAPVRDVPFGSANRCDG